MKTIFSINLLLIISLITLSCVEEKEDSGPQKQLLIFCDLTTSLNLEDIKSQSDKVKQLINAQSYNFQVSVYPMDVSIYQDYLFQDSIPPLNKIHKSKNIAIINKKKNIADSIENILINTYNKHSKNSIDFKSCIISSFEMAYNLLPNDEETLKNTQVVFFTDMVEQCPESIVGSLYMCSKTRQPSFEKILNQVEDKYNPKSKLSDKLAKNQIHIVITSSYGNQKKCITESQQKEVWNEILIKQGYEKPRQIHRSAALPEKL